jgi:hypothetical protein
LNEETFTSEHRAKTRYEQRKSNVDSYWDKTNILQTEYTCIFINTMR